MKIAKNTEPIIAKTTYDHTVIIENLKERRFVVYTQHTAIFCST